MDWDLLVVAERKWGWRIVVDLHIFYQDEWALVIHQ